MNIQVKWMKNNDCYKLSKPITPCGVMVHSTGANNPRISRYVSPTGWDKPNVTKAVHAFVGLLENGEVGCVQTLPWNIKGWHSGKGRNGESANSMGYIGFEICEDGLVDSKYFNAVYKMAVELTAHLCKKYNLNPLEKGVVICHSEGHQMGIASNHADVMHWFPLHGKSMDTFREDVAKTMKGRPLPKPAPVEVRDRYNRFEEIPAWGQPAVDRLIKAGKLKGSGAPFDKDGRPTDMNLSLDMLRLIVMFA